MAPSPVPDFYEYQVPRIISLNRLILRITDPWSDDFLLRVFWYTYRSFTKPDILLAKLFERFNVPPLHPDITPKKRSNSDTKQFSYIDEAFYVIELKRKIQQKVGKVLFNWVSQYFFDFNDNMIEELKNFCDAALTSSGYICLAEKIKETMRTSTRTPFWQYSENIMNESLSTTNSEQETVDLSTPEISGPNFNIMDASEQEIADTLTFMDNQRYNCIKFTEMLEQSWNKEKKRHMAPNILKNINFLNKISNWVSYTILAEDSINERKKLIKKFIRIMTILNKMHSYNMLLAIHSGMSNTAVHRLSNTWIQIKEIFKNLSSKSVEVLSSEKNYALLRETLNKVYEDGRACSPYIGVYLKDIVFSEDGAPTYIDGKINMHKFILIYNCMFKVLRFQGREYDLYPSNRIKNTIDSFETIEDNELFAMSQRIQPRQQLN